MEIKIENSFHFQLEILEIDEHVPSMQMQVIVAVENLGHRLGYRGTVWFECSAWDRYVAELNSVHERRAELVDIGGHFSLWLGPVSGKPMISWEMKKSNMTGGIATAAFRSTIDDDTLAHVKNQFAQFDHWW